ncbi:type VI secretion system-associated FHA domain protein TagH [Novosphingobium album (ex Liu et al. 2023)]|uniref:Type VI secretion system-associated FHA domain protein TagH n=1 Tax=Novosphingobium album (ex Liu et al. 2023) TaxID=3031130 RepID=A0ABT5WUX3_9SPHN|nr:type VI secretion system-associated FHA domain protein TagH [Novosphingobium album (ex Liu et al. 2023)]MDE8653709.1 type VI secretion system-associated FHA domain protein TagH [Novosphingobium album (ex Liu et al. 2023)]
MPLTLTIRNATSLANGSPVSLVLDRRGAKIGRAATADWCLPDPSLHISSQHCEIRFNNGQYELVDYSTNGTFLLGQSARLAAPWPINQGDVFVVGHLEIEARLDESAATEANMRNAAPPPPPQWQGWTAAADPGANEALPGGPQPAPQQAGPAPNPSGWDAPPVWLPEPSPPATGPSWAPAAPPPAQAGEHWAPREELPPPSGWGASPAAPMTPPPPAAASPWNVGPAEPASSASPWSSSPSTPAPASASDIWGKFAESNDVDWARGGFSTARAPQATAPTANFIPPPAAGLSPPPAQPDTPRTVPPRENVPAPVEPRQVLAALANAAGLDAGRLQFGETETLSTAGALLRKLVGGMVILLEARSRAKSQMGARGTTLELDGNNPLKFARTPEQALIHLLNPPERGFMGSERAVEDAFKDLQAHQMATLLAMQGALRVTLERFSPNAIRARAEKKGLLAKILPSSCDAALWKAYEKDFGQVSLGSDEAFMDVFAKEFRRAYDEIAARG